MRRDSRRHYKMVADNNELVRKNNDLEARVPDSMRYATRMGRDLDNMFDKFFGLSPFGFGGFDRVMQDRLADLDRQFAESGRVYDNKDGSIDIHKDLPGVKLEDVKVTYPNDNGILVTVSKHEKDDDHVGYSYNSWSYSSDRRLDWSKSEAVLKDGLLRIHVPAREHVDEPEKTIEVKAE